MQILFISEEAEILKFLSGLQAEAIMPRGSIVVRGMSEAAVVTVICSGGSTHYHGTITDINTANQTYGADGKWLSLKFMVRRINSLIHFSAENTMRGDQE